ncbi:PLDc N-terminal domain-containing protein [Lachnospiraceae bacterium KK002]
MPDVKEFLPFLIPLIIVEFVLLGVTLYHILTHKTYKRGSRGLWIAVVLIGMEFIGPVLYFLLGKEDA